MEIIDYYSELINEIINLKKENLEEIELLHKNVRKKIEEIVVKLNDSEHSKEEIKYSKYAVIAFIDQKVLEHDEISVNWWRTHRLQLELFNTTTAGVDYYEKMEEISKMSLRSGEDLLKLYLYLLFLGFEGNYSGEQQRNLIDNYSEQLSYINDSYSKYSLAIREINPKIRKAKQVCQLKNPRLYIYLYYLLLAITLIVLYIAGSNGLAGVYR